TPPPPARPPDPVLDSLRNSGTIQLGLETGQGLYDRVVWLRQLQRAWARAGKYMSKPSPKLVKPPEEAELARALVAIEDRLQEAPAPLGQPGHPGYRVAALAGQEPVIERFRAMDDQQREALA